MRGDEESAANALKDAYDARIAASNSVEANQRDTQKYLQQLVALRKYEQAQANEAAEDADEDDLNDDGLTDDQVAANKALTAAENQLNSFNEVQGLGDDNPVKNLVNSLLVANGDDGDDDGQALVDAISDTYSTAVDAKTTADSAMNAVEGLAGADGAVAKNADDINDLDGRVTTNEDMLDDHGMKLMQKKEYIDNLAAEIGVDPVTGVGTEANGMSRIDNNESRSMANATAIGENKMTIDSNTTAIGENTMAIESNTTAIGENTTAIGENTMAIEMNTSSIEANMASIGTNADAIAANMNSIGSNSSAISDNRNMIGELSDDLDTVRAGVAASMALAGMPAINGRGISIGVGSFDGESAFAVGFQIQGEAASFKVGVTSASGATGASAGVGFQF